MPFSVSTCLTGLGSVTLGPTLTIYSNPISPTNQNARIQTSKFRKNCKLPWEPSLLFNVLSFPYYPSPRPSLTPPLTPP